MAKMIPSYYVRDEEKSKAEMKIFDWLKNAPDTEDWIVLHSLGIDKHIKLYYGELDFVVLIPEYGLFDLEVKGGRVSCHNGVWSYTDENNHTDSKNRGPFEQGAEGAFSLRNIIRGRLDEQHKYLSYLCIGYGVMFPDIQFDSSLVNEEQWRVFDIRNHQDVKSYLANLADKSKEKYKLKNKNWSNHDFPSKKDCEYIAQLLRPDFDCVVSLNDIVENTDKKIISLTTEEYSQLDLIEENPRVVMRGPAGTGKTLLALEEAKRQVIQGKNVGVFCFNRNLGEWIAQFFHKTCPSMPAYAGTVHHFMKDVLQANGIKEKYSFNQDEVSEYYENLLPGLATGVLKSTGPQFDVLIVDEAQDLLKPHYMDVMDASLRGGLTGGKWMMFGDFILQNIYQSDRDVLDDNLDLLRSRAQFTTGKLTRNCRNTFEICDVIKMAVNSDLLTDYRGRIKGEPVSHIDWIDKQDEAKKLNELLNGLHKDGISWDRIMILSPFTFENSVVSLLDTPYISEYEYRKPETAGFTTIHAFKGLESDILIVTDIDSLNDKKLVYVGLSRAKSKLYLLEKREVLQQLMLHEMEKRVSNNEG